MPEPDGVTYYRCMIWAEYLIPQTLHIGNMYTSTQVSVDIHMLRI